MAVRRSLGEALAMWRRVALFVVVLVSRKTSCVPRMAIHVTRAPSQNTADTFTIFDTTVKCDNDFQKQHWCQMRNADNDRTHESCKCVCRRNFLTFLPELQTCVSNSDVYSFLGDCTKRTQDQTGFPPLSVVSDRDVARFQLAVVPWPSRHILYSSTEICIVNHQNSFYRTDRQWTPINKGVFSLQRNNQLLSSKAVLRWSDNVPNLYSGRILRLDLVNCSDLWRSDVRRPGGCMLLKVAGNISEIISPSRIGATSESPARVTSRATEKPAPLPSAVRTSNTPVTPSKAEAPASVETLGLPTATTAMSFAVERGVSSVYSEASLPTKMQIAPELPSVVLHLPTSSPPPTGRVNEGGTRENLRLIIMIGSAAAGFLVLLIVVVVLAKLCRRKRRSDDYPVKKRARTEEKNNEEASKTTSSVMGGDQADPYSKFAQRNLAYQTTDIINGLRNLRPPDKEADSATEDESPYLKPSDEVPKHNTAEEPIHLDPPDKDPEYHVLEEDEALNDVSHDGPSCEEPTDGQPDYDVLEGPDSASPSQDYGFLVGKAPDAYAALQGQRRNPTPGPSGSQDGQLYTSLKDTGEGRDYQVIQGRFAH